MHVPTTYFIVSLPTKQIMNLLIREDAHREYTFDTMPIPPINYESLSQIVKSVKMFPGSSQVLPFWGYIRDIFSINGWCPKDKVQTHWRRTDVFLLSELIEKARRWTFFELLIIFQIADWFCIFYPKKYISLKEQIVSHNFLYCYNLKSVKQFLNYQIKLKLKKVKTAHVRLAFNIPPKKYVF